MIKMFIFVSAPTDFKSLFLSPCVLKILHELLQQASPPCGMTIDSIHESLPHLCLKHFWYCYIFLIPERMTTDLSPSMVQWFPRMVQWLKDLGEAGCNLPPMEVHWVTQDQSHTLSLTNFSGWLLREPNGEGKNDVMSHSGCPI